MSSQKVFTTSVIILLLQNIIGELLDLCNLTQLCTKKDKPSSVPFLRKKLL